MTVEGPDFICIGMPRAATGWLYDQLQFHPDFWMPPIKELDYLDHAITQFQGSTERLARLENDAATRADGGRLRRKDLDQRRQSVELDRAFLRAASELRGQPRSWQHYKALFSFKGVRLSGDISPGYCRLREGKIAELAEQLPSTKILLLVRDPVSRAWSDISKSNRKGKLEAQLLEDPTAFRAMLLDSRKVQIPSRPTMTVQRWGRYLPPSRFRYLLFDDIVANPAGAVNEILLYLGADAAKKGTEIGPDFNRKSGKEKPEISTAIHEVLVEHFADEIRACAEMFGGAASNWPMKYGL